MNTPMLTKTKQYQATCVSQCTKYIQFNWIINMLHLTLFLLYIHIYQIQFLLDSLHGFVLTQLLPLFDPNKITKNKTKKNTHIFVTDDVSGYSLIDKR